jgi:uncharacterized membrane protein
LNASESPAYFQLFLYLALLDSALAFLPVNRRWPRLRIASFLFTQLYLLGALSGPDRGELPLATTLSFATVYLALFLTQPLRNALAGLDPDAYETFSIAASSAAYYLALHLELYGRHRYWLTAAVVVLAAAFLSVAQAARSRGRAVFAAIALALITGGVAITFRGDVVAILWAIEGALLIGLGLRLAQPVVRVLGYLALALGTAYVLVLTPAGGTAFFNDRFVTLAAFAVAYFAVRYAYGTSPGALNDAEVFLCRAAEPVGHIFALCAVSLELDSLTKGNELSLTLFWLLYAAGLFSAGMLRRAAFVRWEGFVLLTFAILKAFVVDLSAVNPGVRIISFLTLGSVILVISYVSQRYARKAIEPAEGA